MEAKNTFSHPWKLTLLFSSESVSLQGHSENHLKIIFFLREMYSIIYGLLLRVPPTPLWSLVD